MSSLFNRNVVVTQPGRNVWEFEHPWSNTLCSCCTNVKQCNKLFIKISLIYFLFKGCFAFFCPCCYECKLYKRAGESMWTCCCPGARLALRSKIRTAFRIEVIIIKLIDIKNSIYIDHFHHFFFF